MCVCVCVCEWFQVNPSLSTHLPSLCYCSKVAPYINMYINIYMCVCVWE